MALGYLTYLFTGEEVLCDLLDYGFSHGFGQWRTSGAFGTFRYQLDKEA